MFAGWPSVVASCWMGVGLLYCLLRSVYGVSSGIQWGGCVAVGTGGRCCRWPWCGVSSHVLELCSVVGVLVFGMRVRASIAVLVAPGLLFDDVQGVLGVHAFEGHPQPQRLCGEA